MHYAIYMPPGDQFSDPRLLADLAQEAEQAGWDGFFIWDHVVLGCSDRVLDPWVGLSAVAMVTRRIRIGTMVTPIPRRRPWKLARETATLDRLSNGRLTLGVGTGLGAKEWDDLGEETSPKARGKMLDEALQVLAEPVIPPCCSVLIAHALLDNCPRAAFSQEKSVMIELIPRLNSGVIHFCTHATSVLQ